MTAIPNLPCIEISMSVGFSFPAFDRIQFREEKYQEKVEHQKLLKKQSELEELQKELRVQRITDQVRSLFQES